MRCQSLSSTYPVNFIYIYKYQNRKVWRIRLESWDGGQWVEVFFLRKEKRWRLLWIKCYIINKGRKLQNRSIKQRWVACTGHLVEACAWILKRKHIPSMNREHWIIKNFGKLSRNGKTRWVDGAPSPSKWGQHFVVSPGANKPAMGNLTLNVRPHSLSPTFFPSWDHKESHSASFPCACYWVGCVVGLRLKTGLCQLGLRVLLFISGLLPSTALDLWNICPKHKFVLSITMS